MTQMTHYDVLEVSPKASADVIRAAYKSLMQRYHPDKNATESAARAPSIALAYDVLSNPDKRLAYDRELHAMALPEQARGTTRQHNTSHAVARATKPRAGLPARAWYGWLLIVSILVAGGLILGGSGQGSPRKQAVPASGSFSLQRGEATKTAATAPPLAVSSERTISAFMTRLSVELMPANAEPAGPSHFLVIPNLGLRVAGEDSALWIQRIEAQSPALMQQILTKLALAKYEELIKVDADVYLKRLIEDTVSAGIGLDTSDPAVQVRPLTVLLPLSFSIQ